jgi:hypothetical protein
MVSRITNADNKNYEWRNLVYKQSAKIIELGGQATEFEEEYKRITKEIE